MSLVETAPKDRGTVLAAERTDLALQRTISSGTNLMAWIRTALIVIDSFQFYKFFHTYPKKLATGNIKRPASAAQSGAKPFLCLLALFQQDSCDTPQTCAMG